MIKSAIAKQKGADSLPDSPAKKRIVSFAADTKPGKKSKVAASTASSGKPETASPETPPKLRNARIATSTFIFTKDPKVEKAAKEYLDKIAAESTEDALETTASDKSYSAVTEPAGKVLLPRKTAADFWNDNESTESKVDEAVAKKTSKLTLVNDSTSAVKKPVATKKTDKGLTEESAKEKKGAFDTVADKSKISETSKSINRDDELASRQLRQENGEPVTPAATSRFPRAAQVAERRELVKQAEEAYLAASEKFDEARKLYANSTRSSHKKALKKAEEDKTSARVQVLRARDSLEIYQRAEYQERKMSKSTKNDSKMKSGKQDGGVKAEPQRNKKVTDKNVDVNDSDAEQADGVSPEEEPELLKGFDSDSPDDVQDDGVVAFRETPPIDDPNGEILKQLREAKSKAGPDDEAGTIYVGHIPHGFFEVQMRAFFSQFGDITRLRLSRNRRTGASKHFAFIEFASAEVAKIAAKTMDGYLMFGHILKSKFAPADTLHPSVWNGANKKFHKIPHAKLDGQKLAEPKSAEDWEKKGKKEEAKRKRKAKDVKEKMGYESPAGGVSPAKKVKGEK